MRLAEAWWSCPNNPRCPHGGVLHDICGENEVPRCRAGRCRCGWRPEEGSATREEYAAPAAAGTGGQTPPRGVP